MRVYKGFNKKIQAKHGKGTFQYEKGKTYKEEKSKTMMQLSSQQTVKEIIKSFAYGLSAKEISDNEGTSLETMEKFAEEHAAEIEQKKAELKEGGWYE